MKKAVLVALVLFVAAGAAVAETGIGISAGYPVYFISELGFEPEGIFTGVSVRWKPSLFLLDAGFTFNLGGGLSYGFLDGGLCFDLLFLRLALVAGFDFVRFNDPGWGSYMDPGINIKTNLDLKLGPVSLGVSASLPVDILLAALDSSLEDDLRILAAQPTVNLIYWFGRSSKSRRR